MTSDIVEKFVELAKVLTGDRRKRSKMVPEELMSADSIRYAHLTPILIFHIENYTLTFYCRGFKTLASHHGLHSASAPGILALDINVNNTSKILTGGSDKTATVFNKDDEQVTCY